METKIKEVQDYFRNKLTKGDFIIKEFSEQTTTVLIDDLYNFTIWTGNKDYGIELYKFGSESNFMQFSLLESDKKAIWNKLKGPIKTWKEVILKRKKMKEFNRLKKELNIEC